jgi:hypothetical protein
MARLLNEKKRSAFRSHPYPVAETPPRVSADQA